MQTLYRKYRAANFDQLIGQDHIVRIIKQSIVENRISHAYLFTGPRGTGKTSLARLLAKVLNCEDIHANGEPCNKCSNCTSINKGSFLDLVEIDAASNRGIEEIRDLKEKINFLPVEGKKKVYIIDEVHMLTTEAFNALLKTLEEPPQNVIFILATTEPQKLPLTIISRTQRYDFKQADEKSLYKKLKLIIDTEGFNLDEDALGLVVKAGQGSFRDAETVLEKILSSIDINREIKIISRKEVEDMLGFVSIVIVRDFIKAILSNDLNASLEILHKVWNDGMSISQFTKEVLEEVRLELLKSISSPKEKLDNKKMIQIIKEMNQALNEMKVNLLNILPVEIAIFNLIGNVESSIQKETRPLTTPNLITNKNIPVKQQIAKVIVKNKEEKTHVLKNEQKENPIVDEKVENKEDREIKIGTEEAFNKFRKNWNEILTQAKDYNHFLTAILVGSRLEIVNNEIVLIVKSSFHKKRLDNPETRKVLLKIIKDHTGENIEFQCIIEKEKKEIDPTVNNEKMVEEIFN